MITELPYFRPIPDETKIPWIMQILDAINKRREDGITPTLVCLGRKQREEFRQWCIDNENLSNFETVFDLKIIWTTDPDCVTVYEERPYGWF